MTLFSAPLVCSIYALFCTAPLFEAGKALNDAELINVTDTKEPFSNMIQTAVKGKRSNVPAELSEELRSSNIVKDSLNITSHDVTGISNSISQSLLTIPDYNA